MVVSIIACMAKNRAIGFGNRLLYDLPEDLHRFRDLTTGHTIIMGRKTYESLPHGALPHRRNIILSHSPGRAKDCETCASLAEALGQCGEEEEVFIIGGETVYRQALGLASRLYLTVVDDTPRHADAFFPPPNMGEWRKKSVEHHTNGTLHYTFETYEKATEQGDFNIDK